MRLSTRNQLSGVITEVSRGAVKVELDGGEQVATASMTKDAAGDLGLTVGKPATVLEQSTEAMIGVD